MSLITLIGIDPGIVHTGAVMIKLDTLSLAWRVEYEIIEGTDPIKVTQFIKHRDPGDLAFVFVEAYRDRGTVFNTHNAMRTMEQNIKRLVPKAKILDNTGVKKVVTPALMKLFNVWSFKDKTNHEDLRSAARIALYGGLKDDEINKALTAIVMQQLGKEPTNA